MTFCTDNYEGKIETFSGILFDLENPKSTDIRLVDIAHALSATNRFAGHCKQPYSVAQHSVLCSLHSSEPRWSLCHDTAEAYVGDMTRPLKQMLGKAYREIEQRILYAIGIYFKLPPYEEYAAEIKKIDNRLLVTEKRDLMPDNEWWYLQDVEPLPDEIIPWGFAQSKYEFMLAALKLFPHLQKEHEDRIFEVGRNYKTQTTIDQLGE